MTWQLNRIFLNRLTYVYTVGIVLVSVMPVNMPGSSLNSNYIVSIRLDYFFHALLFLLWVCLTGYVSQVNVRTLSLQTSIYLVFCPLFAAAMEIVQYLLPYRSYNINDLLANETGVILGYILMLFLKK